MRGRVVAAIVALFAIAAPPIAAGILHGSLLPASINGYWIDFTDRASGISLFGSWTTGSPRGAAAGFSAVFPSPGSAQSSTIHSIGSLAQYSIAPDASGALCGSSYITYITNQMVTLAADGSNVLWVNEPDAVNDPSCATQVADYSAIFAVWHSYGANHYIGFSLNGLSSHQFINTITPSGAGGTANGSQLHLTWASPSQTYAVGSYITVAGYSPSDWNGNYEVVSSTATSVTVASTAVDSYVSSGTIATNLYQGAGREGLAYMQAGLPQCPNLSTPGACIDFMNDEGFYGLGNAGDAPNTFGPVAQGGVGLTTSYPNVKTGLLAYSTWALCDTPVGQLPGGATPGAYDFIAAWDVDNYGWFVGGANYMDADWFTTAKSVAASSSAFTPLCALPRAKINAGFTTSAITTDFTITMFDSIPSGYGSSYSITSCEYQIMAGPNMDIGGPNAAGGTVTKAWTSRTCDGSITVTVGLGKDCNVTEPYDPQTVTCIVMYRDHTSTGLTGLTGYSEWRVAF